MMNSNKGKGKLRTQGLAFRESGLVGAPICSKTFLSKGVGVVCRGEGIVAIVSRQWRVEQGVCNITRVERGKPHARKVLYELRKRGGWTCREDPEGESCVERKDERLRAKVKIEWPYCRLGGEWTKIADDWG